MKTMIVHDEGESDAGSKPCKDSTLIVRQVLVGKNKQTILITFFMFVLCVLFIHTPSFSILFSSYVDDVVFFVAMPSSVG